MNLERLGNRVGLDPDNLFFRVRFFERLPALLHEWAVSCEDAYTGEFPTILGRV